MDEQRCLVPRAAPPAPAWDDFVRHAPDVVAVVERSGRLRYANEALGRVLGYEVDRVVGRSVLECVHPEDGPRTVRAIARAAEAGGSAVPLTVRLRSSRGTWKHLEAVGIDRSSDPAIGGIVVNARDHTADHTTERFLAGAVSVLESMVTGGSGDDMAASIAALLTDHGVATVAALELQHSGPGVPATDLVGKPGIVTRPILLGGDVVGTLRYRPVESTGGARALAFVVDAVCWLASLLVLRRVSDTRLAHQTRHDAATGLANQERFLELLQLGIDRGVLTGLVLLDVDNLELVNEVRGRRDGDAILTELAARLARLAPAGATVARTGDDEFAVLVERPLDDVDVGRLAVQALDAARVPIPVGAAELHATVSVGVALRRGGEATTQLLGDAEGALRSAKLAGRNRVAFADTSRRGAVALRLAREQELRAGIPRGELTGHLQPIVDLRTGGVVAAELLTRWRHPTLGVLRPPAFMALAEETDLIERIGLWALDAACAHLARPDADGLAVSVNASARELGHAEYRTAVVDALDRYAVPGDRLVIELTEKAAVQTGDATQANLAALRALGVRIHLDDFGTGYSSLACLRWLPIDGLKIDRSFVRDSTTDAAARAILEAVVTVGRALDIPTIAEGVETEGQAAVLHDLGVDAVQGHLYAPPLPADEFAAWRRSSS